jgi:hypothetical protein
MISRIMTYSMSDRMASFTVLLLVRLANLRVPTGFLLTPRPTPSTDPNTDPSL